MSYSAYTGIEYYKNEKWNCLVNDLPDDLKKVHYAFGARGNSMPYVDVDDFDDCPHDITLEIINHIKNSFSIKRHVDEIPDNVSDIKKSDYIPNPSGGYDIETCNPSQFILGVISWNKLTEIRDRVFREITERPHKYKTVSSALNDWLDKYEDNEPRQKIILEAFKMSTDELKLKGFLNNEFAEDDYAELEYYFFALQYACNLIQHYVEEYNHDKFSSTEFIESDNCRLVLWGC